jgi:hypothetical protein
MIEMKKYSQKLHVLQRERNTVEIPAMLDGGHRRPSEGTQCRTSRV